MYSVRVFCCRATWISTLFLVLFSNDLALVHTHTYIYIHIIYELLSCACSNNHQILIYVNLCHLIESLHSLPRLQTESRGQGHQGHHGHSRPLALAWVSVCGARMRGSEEGSRTEAFFFMELKFESQVLIK